MKLTAHLGKITWSLADKGLYVGYGLVQLLQIQALAPEVYGLFSLLVSVNTWIMIVSDGSALQGIIQFGSQQEHRRRVNAVAMMLYLGIVTVAVIVAGIVAVAFQARWASTVVPMLPVYCLLTMPRMFCMKLLYRDMRMRDVFVADLVWFSVRTLMTVWALRQGSLATFDDILIIDLAGMAASSAIAMLLTRKELRFSLAGGITFREYLRFGVPLALATGLNSTPRQLDVVVIEAFFGAAVVGVYNSAKNLYRAFEQAFDAAVTLLYPAAVRVSTQGRMGDLQVLSTKAISFTMFPVIAAVLVLELGGSSLIVPLLGKKYAAAVGHFNVLCLSALAMPFMLMSSVMAAMGHSRSIVRFSLIGLIVATAVLVLVGVVGAESWIGLGLVANSAILGYLCSSWVRREVDFPWTMTLRAVTDVQSAVATFRGRRKV